LGTYYELKSQSKLQDAKSNCTSYPNDCSPQGVAFNNDSIDASKNAAIWYVTGGGVLVSGVLMYLLAPSSYVEEHATWTRPRLMPLAGMHTLGCTALSEF
jgi:hypothetical protein